MLRVLTGENSYALEQRLGELTSRTDSVDMIDGADLTHEQLLSSTAAQSLFATERIVVVKRASENSSLWSELPTWLENIADHIELILVEPRPDKRTATYKWLQKNAAVENFDLWTTKQHAEAQTWLIQHAAELGVALDNKLAQALLSRVGYNQWNLHTTLEKLALRPKDSKLSLEDIADSSTQDSVFELLEAAFAGNTAQVSELIGRMKRSEDPYAVFGLLASQVTQLAVLSLSDASTAQLAKETGLHPFSLQKLKPHARRLGAAKVAEITKRLADIDRRIKSSDIDIWAAIEQQLLHIAQN